MTFSHFVVAGKRLCGWSHWQIMYREWWRCHWVFCCGRIQCFV